MRPLRLYAAATDLRSGDARLPDGAADAQSDQHTKTVSASAVGFFAIERLVALRMDDKIKRTPKAVTVSERNLQSAAVRLLPKHNRLVSTEVDYLRRVLGDRATQGEIDEKVLQVRKLPWSKLLDE